MNRRKPACGRFWSACATIALGLALSSGIEAQTEPFYAGKTIRTLVGASPGGGFDAYSRTVARHLGRQIPGHPTVIVENMTGAGGLVMANYLYKAGRPDGLTIGNINGALFTQQLLGRPGIEFDAVKFGFLGAPVMDKSVCVLTRASGITSAEKWISAQAPVKLGATGPGSLTYNVPRILAAVLGFPIHLVTGYKGVADIRLAAESGELAGACGWSWDSLKATWTKALQSGAAVVVLQTVPQPLPDLPEVPLAIKFARTGEASQLVRSGIHDVQTVVWSYVAPPGTPRERLQMLRRAFQGTVNDPEFLADAKKSNLGIDPVSGEELEAAVSGLFRLKPEIVARLKEILK